MIRTGCFWLGLIYLGIFSFIFFGPRDLPEWLATVLWLVLIFGPALLIVTGSDLLDKHNTDAKRTWFVNILVAGPSAIFGLIAILVAIGLVITSGYLLYKGESSDGKSHPLYIFLQMLLLSATIGAFGVVLIRRALGKVGPVGLHDFPQPDWEIYEAHLKRAAPKLLVTFFEEASFDERTDRVHEPTDMAIDFNVPTSGDSLDMQDYFGPNGPDEIMFFGTTDTEALLFLLPGEDADDTIYITQDNKDQTSGTSKKLADSFETLLNDLLPVSEM